MSNYKAYLRKQPTFDEITGYIYFGQDKITYPDRSATILRNSPYLGIYDGITFHELEEQEEQIEKEKLKEAAARELARKEKKTYIPPEPKKGGTWDPPKGGGKGIGGGTPPAIGQPSPIAVGGALPVSVREDEPLGIPNIDSKVEDWQDAKEYEDVDIEEKTKQRERNMIDTVDSLLGTTAHAIKNTAGALMTATDLSIRGAVAGAKIAGAGIEAGVWTAEKIADLIDWWKGNGSSTGYDDDYSIGGTYGGSSSSGGPSSSSGGGLLPGFRKTSGVSVAESTTKKTRTPDVEVDKAFIKEMSKKNPGVLKKTLMDNPIMIEIIDRLPEEQRTQLQENINDFKPRQLANVLAHLRGGLTAGIAAM